MAATDRSFVMMKWHLDFLDWNGNFLPVFFLILYHRSCFLEKHIFSYLILAVSSDLFKCLFAPAFLIPTLLFLPHLLTTPHKTKSKLTNCDRSLIGLPLGITPNGCCAERLTPSPTAMEACQAMQVTFIAPWMQALPLKEDTSNLFLLSKKELLIWIEEL